MFGNPRGLLDQETSKPKATGETLARLAGHFKPYWPILILTVVFVTLSTWLQVTTPELTGQIVDCYLTPAVSDSFGDSPIADAGADASESNCWLSPDIEGEGLTQRVIKQLMEWIDVPAPPAEAAVLSTAERGAGLAGTAAILVGMFVMISLLTGLTFFSMSW